MRFNNKRTLFIGFGLLVAGACASAACASISTMPAESSQSSDLSNAAKLAKPYTLKGKHYTPLASVKAGYTETGTASWYDVPTNFGAQTASGERLNAKAMTAASPILPMNTKVKVTNLANNKSVIVRINDRGPYNSIHGPYPSKRILDLTHAAANKLGYGDAGTAKVKMTVI